MSRVPCPRLLVVALGLALVACDGAPSAPRHVLLVTLDTTRADRLGCYGYGHDTSPVVDGLAARGVLFERCQATAPLTIPSHASLLTGLYPFRHGARHNGTHGLPRDVTTLAEQLSAAGFVTGAAVSARVLDATFGLDQGFASYDDRLHGVALADGYVPDDVPAADTVDRALEWWARQDGARPLFFWLHLFDPHQPLVAPEPHRSRHADGYDAELAYADAQLGRLLDDLERRDLLDDTLVVVTADHGESLGEHGEATHGLFVYEATQHVPLVLAHDALPAGRRVSAVTSGVDVVPTVLELLGRPLPAEALDGRSLRPLIEGRDDWDDDRAVYADTLLPWYAYGWSDLRAVVDARGRFVRAPASEWFDHATDPDERADGTVADAAALAAGARRLAELLRDGERGLDDDPSFALDDDLARSLVSLGYVSAQRRVGPGEGAELRDPKDGVDDLAAADRAGLAVERGHFEQALSLLAPVREALPGASEIDSLYAQALIGTGRVDEARAVLTGLVMEGTPGLVDLLRLAELEHPVDAERARGWLELFRQRAPGSPLPAIQESAWALEAGDAAAARAAADRALGRDPTSVPAWLAKGRSQQLLDDASGALMSFRQATLIDPGHAEARFLLGWQSLTMGRFAEARRELEQAAQSWPGHAPLWGALGVAREQLGDRPGALAAYRRAVELDPGDTATATNLARLSASG